MGEGVSSRCCYLGALLLACGAAAPSADVRAQGLITGSTQVTPEQSKRGEAAYAQACASCHGASLEGTQFGPALRGPAFESHWRGASRAAFSEKLRTTMPPGKLGILSPETYADLEGYLLNLDTAGAPETKPPAAADAAAPRPQQGAARVGSSMMGPMQRNGDDPQYLAAMQSRKGRLSALSAVTDEMLAHPAPADWIMWRRSYDALGYSPLAQIDRSNVKQLRVAWSWTLPQSTNEITPLVHDGVMFVYSGAAVQALDAVSGDLLWQYVRPMSGGSLTSHGKSLAIYGEKLFAIAPDAHVIALNARTGQLLWDQEVVPSGPAGGGLGLNTAVMVVKGTVMVGVSTGVAYHGGCFIVGLDAETGKERWRFHTVARPGQPGGDTWNGAPVEERFGGGVWMGGSYDPTLNLVYFGIGNTYDTSTLLQPRPGASGLSANDGLYTDSSVALRPESGELAWYYQHQKRDTWDLDWSFEQSLVTLKVDGHPRRLVISGGKTALFDAVDAATGAYVFSKDLGVQNIVTAIDPATGEKTINPALQPESGKPKLMCPNSIGARNWMATAVNPESGVLYVPMLENCADYTYTAGTAEQTAKGGIDIHFSSRTPPGHDGNFGRLAALDLGKRQILWTHRQRIPLASAVLATGGGLIFAGDVDRNLYAYDQANGAVLWRTRLASSAESFPVSFAAQGRQYIAVVTGSGSPMGAASRAFVPEVSAPAGGVSVTVFELPAHSEHR